MGKFSSQEIESQYDLIKMLLDEPEKYRDAINTIKKDIAYMPVELKKNLRKKLLSYEWIVIEIQYNLFKILLAEPEKYRDSINAIKKDIA